MHTQIRKTLIVCAALACAAPVGAAPSVHGHFAFAPASYIGVGEMDINDEPASEIGLVEAHAIEFQSGRAVTPFWMRQWQSARFHGPEASFQ